MESKPRGSTIGSKIMNMIRASKRSQSSYDKYRLVSNNIVNYDSTIERDEDPRQSITSSAAHQRTKSFVPNNRDSALFRDELNEIIIKEEDAIKRREKLLNLAKHRQNALKVQDNLFEAAMANKQQVTLMTSTTGISDGEDKNFNKEDSREKGILLGILEKEKSHLQWGKHSVCFIVLASQVLVNLIRT